MAVALATLVLLTACGGSGRPDPTATPAPTETPTAPTPTPGVAAIDKIVWARDVDPKNGAPVNEVLSFSPDAPAIYALVAVKNVTPGLTLTATWTYNGTALKGVGATIVATRPIADGWLEFHLAQAVGNVWPLGTYEITITQRGAEPASAKVVVKRGGS
jgi:hypothetical protein